MEPSRPIIIGACILGALHFLTVGLVLLSTGGSGERQALLAAFADFPIFFLLSIVPGGGYVLYDSVRAYLLVFVVLGALMYAAIGGLLGYLIVRIRR